MRARAQGKAPARAAFAGKVSECVCLSARKAPARAAFTVAASPAAAFPAGACACASNNLCAMTLPRAEVRDPPVLTAGVIRSPRPARSLSLEPRNYELDIRLKPVGFLLVEIHRRFIKVGRLHGRALLTSASLLGNSGMKKKAHATIKFLRPTIPGRSRQWKAGG